MFLEVARRGATAPLNPPLLYPCEMEKINCSFKKVNNGVINERRSLADHFTELSSTSTSSLNSYGSPATPAQIHSHPYNQYIASSQATACTDP